MKWSIRKIIVCSLVTLALLAIMIFAVWRMRLASDVNESFAAIHAAGLPTNSEEEDAYYADVPIEENAAIKMEAAFDMMTTYGDSRSNEVAAIKFWLNDPPLTTQELELVTGYWAMNSNALATAQEAIKLPRSRYPMDLSLGAATLLPHLAKLRSLSRLVSFQAKLKPEDSQTAVKTILGMARTLDSEPVLISKLVEIAVVSEAVSVCERRLNNGGANQDELAEMDKLFAAAGTTNQIANGLIGERAMNTRYFRMSWADIKKFSDDDGDNVSVHGQMPNSPSQPFFFKLTGLFERDLRFYLWSMETNIALAGKFPINVGVISNAQVDIERTSQRNYYLLSSMFLPALGNAIFREASCLAQVRMTQTALAVERFRLANQRLPENLNQLVPQFIPAVPQDPCDGQSLRFRLLEKGYLIYSVGKDGEDNGGRERPVNAKSGDKTPYDLAFTVKH